MRSQAANYLKFYRNEQMKAARKFRRFGIGAHSAYGSREEAVRSAVMLARSYQRELIRVLCAA